MRAWDAGRLQSIHARALPWIYARLAAGERLALTGSPFEVLLVGPRARPLEALVAARRLHARCLAGGAEALETLEQSPAHVVIVDLDLDDIEARDFLLRARAVRPDAGYVLLGDPAKAHLIVSTLVHGSDAYVPSAPEERYLLEVVLRHAEAAEARRRGSSAGLEEAQAEIAHFRQRVRELEAALERAEHENALLGAEVEDLKDALDERGADLDRPPQATDARVLDPLRTEPVEPPSELDIFLSEDDDDWESEPTVAQSQAELAALAQFRALPDTVALQHQGLGTRKGGVDDA